MSSQSLVVSGQLPVVSGGTFRQQPTTDHGLRTTDYGPRTTEKR